MSSDVDPPKSESVASIPQKRTLDESHSPAVSSPLNTEIKPQQEDTSHPSRPKPSRAKKDSLKKREAKGADSGPATPDQKPSRDQKLADSAPLRYKLAPPKPSDFDLPRGPILTSHHDIVVPDGRTIEFLETSEHVFNKKNFRYTHCIADPLFRSILYYRQTEPEPFGPRLSFEDAATHVFFDRSALQITTDKGFRMTRANVAVREGRWYWECRILQGVTTAQNGKPQGGKHVRMGWARREASLDAPVGFDAYSYGIRDVAGEKVHMSRPKEFFPPGEGIREGDVIGLEIQLPSEHLHRKVMSGDYNPAVDAADDESSVATEPPNIVRDRVPIRFKAHTYFEKIEYHTTKELEDLMNPSSLVTGPSTSQAPNPNHPSPALRTLPNSCIRVYKNGVLMGTPFENLLAFLPPASRPMPQVGARDGLDDGMLGYYPAVSIFRGGAAEVNFGPDFWYPPPEYDSTNGEVDMIPTDEPQPQQARVQAVSDRYRQQIAEDIVYDIIDEVDFWMMDGGGVASDHNGQTGTAGVSVMGPGREEIKELVQDY
ncbi:hypothetical protein CDD80_3997 [Ophiocordyceps camponoti-rufipedis]|uniref:B30.2/SPRY domain-containing protein n=1 Tax=Ophiocordyceps camponoti-rufipedis TaxID=2004952 RepID=A0A2C5Z1V8_9HYPO|nr:hypothetical protein CDD80_3997 [Ophiocordyceps camponoti-rufipedis]